MFRSSAARSFPAVICLRSLEMMNGWTRQSFFHFSCARQLKVDWFYSIRGSSVRKRVSTAGFKLNPKWGSQLRKTLFHEVLRADTWCCIGDAAPYYVIPADSIALLSGSNGAIFCWTRSEWEGGESDDWRDGLRGPGRLMSWLLPVCGWLIIPCRDTEIEWRARDVPFASISSVAGTKAAHRS